MTTPTLSERLRSEAEAWDSGSGDVAALYREAADALDARDSEIDRLRAELAISRPPLPVRMADCNVYCATAKGLIEDVDRLRAENARLRADAERYRWLRSGASIIEASRENRRCQQPLCIVTTPSASLPIYGDEMDAAIDAALKDKP